MNVASDEFSAICEDALYREIYEQSLTVPDACSGCRHSQECAGGQLNTRWSSKNRFRNRSVYCDDYKLIFDHIKSTVKASLYEEPEEATCA